MAENPYQPPKEVNEPRRAQIDVANIVTLFISLAILLTLLIPPNGWTLWLFR